MRSKVIFIVMFMLSFSIAHDTIINTIQTNEHHSSIHYTSDTIQIQKYNSDCIDDIHAMFHMEALITPNMSSFIQLPTKQLLSHISFTYSFTYKETSYKPPKA